MIGLLVALSLAPAIPNLDDDHEADVFRPSSHSSRVAGAVLAGGGVACVSCVGGAVGVGAVVVGGANFVPCIAIGGPVSAVVAGFVDEGFLHDGLEAGALAHGGLVVGGYVVGALAAGVPVGMVSYGAISDVPGVFGALLYGVPAALVGGSVGAGVVAGILAYSDLDPLRRVD